MQVLGAVAEFERDLLIERTQQGLMRAKAEGKKLGRPVAVKTTAPKPRFGSHGQHREASEIWDRPLFLLGTHLVTKSPVHKHGPFRILCSKVDTTASYRLKS